jgi:putative membrane protein
MSKQNGTVLPSAARPRNYKPLVIGLSAVVYLVVGALFYLPGYAGVSHLDLTVLPMVNAILNSFTFIFLSVALFFIKRKEIASHRRFILAAFTTTTLFLLSYVTYHSLTESTRYGGVGPLRYVYFFFLLTHVLLAAGIVPLALFSLGSGLTLDVEKHRKLSRWTMPLWLYVSFTGVVVYLMIRPYY